jgi:hypothetical protein
VATGPRESAQDKGCDHTIRDGASGYCECVRDVQVKFGCKHESFTCKAKCYEHFHVSSMMIIYFRFFLKKNLLFCVFFFLDDFYLSNNLCFVKFFLSGIQNGCGARHL